MTYLAVVARTPNLTARKFCRSYEQACQWTIDYMISNDMDGYTVKRARSADLQEMAHGECKKVDEVVAEYWIGPSPISDAILVKDQETAERQAESIGRSTGSVSATGVTETRIPWVGNEKRNPYRFGWLIETGRAIWKQEDADAKVNL